MSSVSTLMNTLVMSSTVTNMVALNPEVSMDETRYGEFDVSPVTLSPDWSRVARLLLLASLAVVGSVGNVFMISAVMVEDHLKKRGNTFLVNVALADLLVTGMVIPASAIVILAGQNDTLGICRFEWTLEALCFLVTVLSMCGLAIENYVRLCLPPERYNLSTECVTTILLSMWVIAAIAIGLQSFYDIGPDFCNKRFGPISKEQKIGASFLVCLPLFITFIVFSKLICHVRSRTTSHKPSIAFSSDYELVKTNFYSFILFVAFWTPLGTILAVSSIKKVTSSVFIFLAWFALSKSCFNSLLYCIANRHFRSAYVKLFHYCCCKTTVSFSRRPRAETGRGDVRLRVHIIHSYTGPSCRQNASSRSNGRDVYEL